MNDTTKQDVKIVILVTLGKDGKSNIAITDESINPPENMLNKIILLKTSEMMSELSGGCSDD